MIKGKIKGVFLFYRFFLYFYILLYKKSKRMKLEIRKRFYKLIAYKVSFVELFYFFILFVSFYVS